MFFNQLISICPLFILAPTHIVFFFYLKKPNFFFYLFIFIFTLKYVFFIFFFFNFPNNCFFFQPDAFPSPYLILYHGHPYSSECHPLPHNIKAPQPIRLLLRCPSRFSFRLAIGPQIMILFMKPTHLQPRRCIHIRVRPICPLPPFPVFL